MENRIEQKDNKTTSKPNLITCLYHKNVKVKEYPTLVVTEGSLKAWKASQIGIPCICLGEIGRL